MNKNKLYNSHIQHILNIFQHISNKPNLTTRQTHLPRRLHRTTRQQHQNQTTKMLRHESQPIQLLHRHRLQPRHGLFLRPISLRTSRLSQLPQRPNQRSSPLALRQIHGLSRLRLNNKNLGPAQQLQTHMPIFLSTRTLLSRHQPKGGPRSQLQKSRHLLRKLAHTRAKQTHSQTPRHSPQNHLKHQIRALSRHTRAGTRAGFQQRTNPRRGRAAVRHSHRKCHRKQKTKQGKCCSQAYGKTSFPEHRAQPSPNREGRTRCEESARTRKGPGQT